MGSYPIYLQIPPQNLSLGIEMKSKVITINNWKRPNMFKQVLEGLAKNPEIDDYEIISIVDEHPNKSHEQRFINIAFDSALNVVTTLLPTKHMGCAGAKRTAFEVGFGRGADFVINLEDDIVPGASFLHYMEYADKIFRDDPNVHAVIGWARTVRESDGDFNKILVRTPDRTYQAFGLWKETWKEIGYGKDWFGIHWNEKVYKPKDGEGHTYTGQDFIDRITKTDKGSWGWPMLNYWRKNRKCVIPVISRCQNIGNTEGAFNFNPDWHRTWIWNTCWAEDRPAPLHYEVIEQK